jgi:AraC-like DNA-binding protein
VLGAHRARSLVDDRALDRWLRSVRPDGLALAAVRLLPSQSVSDTADQLGLSVRQLQRVLARETGISPKAFQRVVRLRTFLREAERGASLATAAAVAGYADQPHLTRDIRVLSGLTPARLLAERQIPGGKCAQPVGFDLRRTITAPTPISINAIRVRLRERSPAPVAGSVDPAGKVIDPAAPDD